MNTTSLIKKMYKTSDLSYDEFSYLLNNYTIDDINYINFLASNISKEIFGNKIFIRGLIEITNYCGNDCYYCGIRKSNDKVERYRLTQDEILNCCEKGYRLGIKTFVMQGGECGIKDESIIKIISKIRATYNDCAITLSLGERDKKVYNKFYEAGANRYLLRHETADKLHYQKMHPDAMSWENRINCINNLKAIGFQTGMGFMIGSPFQTIDCIIKDLKLIKLIKPEMIGIGPFLPALNTPFANYDKGNLELTLLLISILRIMNRNALIPSTTALATLSCDGREKGILAGANVVMPNLSPFTQRHKYSLYDNKKFSDNESAECLKDLDRTLKNIGYEISYSRGDYKNI